jgi:AraC-like DNA-binding protein
VSCLIHREICLELRNAPGSVVGAPTYTYAEAMNVSVDLIAHIRRHTERSSQVGSFCPTGVDGLTVMQARHPTTLTPTVYTPVVCLILQGAKEIALGPHVIECGPGASVIVSHTLPIESRITRATYDTPYVAMVLQLEIGVLRSLVNDIDGELSDEPASIAIEVDQAEPQLIDAMGRLFALADDRAGARVLAPLIRREIHYRLVTAEHGSRLRALLDRSSHDSRILRAIDRIRSGYADSLSVVELAGIAAMSPSSFHEHFKAVTATTPLQYQKELRLLEARRLLVDEQRSVTEAAFDVGYHSPTQFSREYSRKFGVPPREDRISAGALT